MNVSRNISVFVMRRDAETSAIHFIADMLLTHVNAHNNLHSSGPCLKSSLMLKLCLNRTLLYHIATPVPSQHNCLQGRTCVRTDCWRESTEHIFMAICEEGLNVGQWNESTAYQNLTQDHPG